MAGCETRWKYVDEDSTSLHIYHVLQKDIIILFTKVKIKKGLYGKNKTRTYQKRYIQKLQRMVIL